MVLGKITELGENKKRKHYEHMAQLVATFEPETEELPDDALKAKTDAFKQRLSAGESLDDILPEAFAAVRESARRHLG